MKKFKKIVIAIIVLILCFSAGAYAAYTFQAGDVKYTKADGTVVSVESALNDLYNQTNGNNVYPIYTQGDTVTLGGEQFYVLTDSFSSDPKVTLIARYCLNNTNLQTQTGNSDPAGYGKEFAPYPYWHNGSFASYPADIGTNDGGMKISAIAYAKNYASLKGGTGGRLLTKSEIDVLNKKVKDRI